MTQLTTPTPPHSLPLSEEWRRAPDRRCVPSSLRKRWDVKGLQERHHEMLNMIALGAKNVEVAKALGVSEVSVSMIKNSTLGVKRLAAIRERRNELVEEALGGMGELASLAVGVYKEILQNPNAPEALRLRAAKEMLYHPVVAPTPTASREGDSHVHNHLHLEVIEEMKQRGVKVAREMGYLVDL